MRVFETIWRISVLSLRFVFRLVIKPCHQLFSDFLYYGNSLAEYLVRKYIEVFQPDWFEELLEHENWQQIDLRFVDLESPELISIMDRLAREAANTTFENDGDEGDQQQEQEHEEEQELQLDPEEVGFPEYDAPDFVYFLENENSDDDDENDDNDDNEDNEDHEDNEDNEDNENNEDNEDNDGNEDNEDHGNPDPNNELEDNNKLEEKGENKDRRNSSDTIIETHNEDATPPIVHSLPDKIQCSGNTTH